MIEKAEVTALLQQLTAIKSEYFHEDEIMAFAKDWLCRQELPAQLHEYHDAKVTDSMEKMSSPLSTAAGPDRSSA